MTNKKLNLEQLENVNGGYLYKNGKRYEIIDDQTGEVLQGDLSYGDAVTHCLAWDVGTREISAAQLDRLRKTGSISG